ncbi:MAG: DUF21 domain-containing protein [Planctomycetales bacterium]|nr:DUF21 domain-containing protein [Planctomycetales bacterium]
MGIAILLFAGGLALSAFFSGSETGFYRATRVRLLIDAISGDWIAKGLLWATNNPALFVATALIGNNVANYLISCSTVMMGGMLLPGWSSAELALTLAFSPIVFIYGELFPKNLFYQAPGRLLRRCAPGLAVAGVLFLPLSALLWLVGMLLQWIARAPSQALRMEIARRELAQVLDEGHAIGLLSPAQRRLAKGTFNLAGRAVRDFMVPTVRLTLVDPKLSRSALLEKARQARRPVVMLSDYSGYVRAIDCLLEPEGEGLPVREFLQVAPGDRFLATLLKMQSTNRAIALVKDKRDRLLGCVFSDRLLAELVAEQDV